MSSNIFFGIIPKTFRSGPFGSSKILFYYWHSLSFLSLSRRALDRDSKCSDFLECWHSSAFFCSLEIWGLIGYIHGHSRHLVELMAHLHQESLMGSCWMVLCVSSYFNFFLCSSSFRRNFCSAQNSSCSVLSSAPQRRIGLTNFIKILQPFKKQ